MKWSRSYEISLFVLTFGTSVIADFFSMQCLDWRKKRHCQLSCWKKKSWWFLSLIARTSTASNRRKNSRIIRCLDYCIFDIAIFHLFLFHTRYFLHFIFIYDNTNVNSMPLLLILVYDISNIVKMVLKFIGITKWNNFEAVILIFRSSL